MAFLTKDFTRPEIPKPTEVEYLKQTDLLSLLGEESVSLLHAH